MSSLRWRTTTKPHNVTQGDAKASLSRYLSSVVTRYIMMTNQEIAKEYIKCFCDSDIDGLEPLLATDLKFIGTFYTYHSRAEYLEDLREDPPEKCGYKMLSMTENDDSIAVFYEYHKLPAYQNTRFRQDHNGLALSSYRRYFPIN